MAAKIDVGTRKITLDVPELIPSREARAALHRLLDEALDAFLEPKLIEPEGPGRIADQEAAA